MTGGNRVYAIGPGGPAGESLAASGDDAELLLSETEEFLLTDEVKRVEKTDDQWLEDDTDDPEASADRSWAVPMAVLAGLLVAIWTAVFAWSRTGGTAVPVEVNATVSAVTAWAPPVLLVAVIWLLAMRHSRREAARFGDVASALAAESERLSVRLATVNSELSLAREFIAAQSRDLESFGRMACDRLSQNAEQLQSLVGTNSEQIEAISSVSGAALDNMEKLRSQLPVIASSARDVTNHIGSAGRTAQAQLQEMIAGFKRLNEFGQASERQVESLREVAGGALSELVDRTEQLEKAANERFAAMKAQSDEFGEQLDRHENDALEGLRNRAKALAAEIERTRGKLEAHEEESLSAQQTRSEAWRAQWDETVAAVQAQEAEALAALGERMAALDAEVAIRRGRQDEQTRALTENGTALASQMAELEERITALVAHGRDADTQLSRAANSLAERLAEGRAALSGADSEIAALTDSGVRLLELIQAGSQHSREQIPAALALAEGRLEAIERRVSGLRESASEAADAGERVGDRLVSVREGLAGSSDELAALQASLDAFDEDQRKVLDRVRSALAEIESKASDVSERSRGELSAAFAELNRAAADAVDGIGQRSAAGVRAVADNLAEQSAAAIDTVMQQRAAEVARALEDAASRAAEASRTATIQLRDQLTKVNELAGNLEQRVAYARERAEEQIDNEFARRVALITESLNSSAIDIARGLDTEVTDTAWANYLKGDRGVFTRRAVSLISSAEGKSIMSVYESDEAFRDNVNRFIHDFEAMLRQILSTRDGHALGVTLLSSDMGKLYVALAQALERIRN